MSREINSAAQEKLGQIVNAGEFDRLGEVFAPDVVDHDPAPGQGPGPEGFRTFFTALTEAFPDAHLDVDALAADEDFVTIAYRLTGTHEGDFHGVAGTGTKIEARGVQLARFNGEGQIVERWGSTDELGILTQLGVRIGG
jgi:steroid delta-isomerase-like uncharacterized protein